VTLKPPKIGVTVLTVSGLDGYGAWRKLQPRNRSIGY
jgi:hypothetical protein